MNCPICGKEVPLDLTQKSNMDFMGQGSLLCKSLQRAMHSDGFYLEDGDSEQFIKEMFK
jgi:hypothetical protein